MDSGMVKKERGAKDVSEKKKQGKRMCEKVVARRRK